MRKWMAILLLMIASSVIMPAFANDLIEVYCEALQNDPTFKGEYADLLSTKENVPIARASLLPRVDFNADVQRQRIDAQGLQQLEQVGGVFVEGSEEPFYNTSVEYILSAKQPLFNYSAWARLQTAKAEAREAEARFCAAAQDLIIRVAEAYFEVMKAHSDLYYINAQRRAIAAQLAENKARFKAGVVSITNVYEAQSSYDINLTRKEKAEYELIARLDDLRKITGTLYCALQGLSYLPLIEPDPACDHEWVDLALAQNYSLKAACFARLAARENIKIEFGGHLPVLSATGEYRYSYDSNPSGTGDLLRIKTASVGLNLQSSIYKGGEVNARTTQAHYFYYKATHEECLTQQEVIGEARRAFHGIISGIKQIRSGKAAIKSTRESLKATTISYRIGTRTVLDVLNVQTKLYETYITFVRNQYDYLLQTLLLKRAAGTLCVNDLQYINCWLQREIVFPVPDGECCNTCDLPVPNYKFNHISKKLHVKL